MNAPVNTTVKEAWRCPSCGQPMPAGALAGFCPACLLKQGAQTDPGGPGEPGRFQPLPEPEVARLFPQLEILGLLGAGGMGAVYKARQPALDRLVALKILPAAGQSRSTPERFNREARALARLNHPSIVAVHEFGQVRGLHFFIMEFVDGANLRQLERTGRLSPREALQIIPQICDALQYAHDEGVVHRDIKPENVLVDRKGRVKIADFGLAKIAGAEAGSARLTAEGQVMGTPHYMAPEQVDRPLSVDHRADIYSLGVVIYEMLTGDLPLGKFPPPSRKVEVDVRLDEVVLRALENDPERRYQKVSEVKSSVETIASTPAPADVAPAPESKERYAGWFGFAVVSEHNGERRVNWKGTLAALGVAFGILTIAFAFVTTFTGRSLLGWVGVKGWPSLLARLAIAGLAVSWGVKRALRSASAAELVPETGRATVILPSWRKRWLLGRRLVEASLMILLWSVFQVNWLTPWLNERFGLLQPPQIAQPEASTGALVANLPNGGRIELLAIGSPSAVGGPWWRPDGLPLAKAAYELRGVGDLLTSDKRVPKDFLFRFRDLPEGASRLDLQADPNSGSTGGAQVYLGELPRPDLWQTRMAWAPEIERVTLRCRLGLVPWRTIAIENLITQSGTQTREPGDPRWTCIFERPNDGAAGDAQITVVFGPKGRHWESRVVAVDTNEVEHASVLGHGTMLESDQELWTYQFSGLPMSRVKEFRLQVRPVHWVEFRHVAVKPRLSAAAATKGGRAAFPAPESWAALTRERLKTGPPASALFLS